MVFGLECVECFKVFFQCLLVLLDMFYCYLVFYVLFWVGLVVWGWSYIMQSFYQFGYQFVFLYNVNLLFYEVGYVIFGIFGLFIGFLGGILGQLLVLVICGVVLLWCYDIFGVSVCLWWFGENFFDIVFYMVDVCVGELLLLGGNYGKFFFYGFYDWEFIFGEIGFLVWDKMFVVLILNSGWVIMVLVMVWGVWLLWWGWCWQYC